jgi:hypothetical protein
MAQTATNQSSREMALARRHALSSKGKAGLTATAAANNGRAATAKATPSAATSAAATPTARASSARAASRARREAMSSSGKAGIQSRDRIRTAEGTGVSPSTPVPQQQPATHQEEKPEKGCGCGCNGKKASCNGQPDSTDSAMISPSARSVVRNNKRQMVARAPGRAASLARREAMSTRGKAGLSANGMSAAQTARAANPHLSGRELAQALREQRSRNGKAGQKKSQPSGRVRPAKEGATGAAQDAPWKVGESETAQGQTVTGTMVGRSHSVTGDEPSTCRTVTGTEYMGADIFRDFCQSDPKTPPSKVTVTSTSHGSSVSGNSLGRGSNVTGNEPGTCKRVTGNEYISAEQSQGFCGEFMKKSPRKVSVSETGKGKTLTGSNIGRSEKVTGDETGANRVLTGTQYMQSGDGHAPAKVGTSATLRGGNVTGTMVGRGQRTTGDEAGSCRNVTGDDYVGQEQYSSFCESTPAPEDKKVGISSTLKGKGVTGTMTGRSGRVTGDEPGTCKAVTGTPYAGSEQFQAFCEADETTMAAARMRQQRSTPGAVMTGQQPGVGGKMTGDARGACETVSGTPYVGADQYADACPATAADTASPDFPQSIDTAPWQQFSVSSPAGEARQSTAAGSVTGNQYEQGQITGPFGMAPGKVTGTEQARFGDSQANAPAIPATAEMIEGRVKSRITGEGMDAGAKITGDDWDRGDNVTGTEGSSATRRNPTMRQAPGAAMAAASAPQKRNVEMTVPSSKVTGGSGNTEQGALVTYSGGARG